jgi:hypothetical protein
MPTITFQVNLQNPHSLDWSQPFTSDEAANFSNTRVTFLPDFLRDNYELTNGSQFTVSGTQAVYLKNLYATGSGDYNILTIVSES